MDSWREIILAKLDQYAGFDLDVQDTQIAVICQNPDSFSVTFIATDGGYQVAFDGWHEDFDDVEDALNCFAFGLSEECRLKVVLRGTTECSWTVESWKSDEWEEDSVTGLIFVPFWRPSTVRYYQNKLEKKL